MATKTSQQSEARTVGFLILSSLFHTALAIGVLTLSLNAKKIVEVTEVQFLDSKPELSPVQKAPEPAIETVKEEIATAPVPTPQIEAAKEVPQEAPISHAPPAPVKIAKTLPAAAAPKAVAKTAEQAPAAEKATVTQTESPVVLPVLETAELDEAQASEAKTATAELNDEDIADDLNKVDQEQNAKTAALQNELESNTEKELNEQNAKLAALQKQTEDESAQLAAANAEKRAQERAALAAAQAAEAKSAAEAKAAAEAQAAKLANAGGVEGGQGAGQGEIRALEDLKQISGNRRPMYDADDRLKNRQGEVAFLAYVSKQGSINQFKMIKSSGHRELDIKTLKAIRDWKFYPGQEGWVEIPFKWDLKGGPQEMPATLRRAKVSTTY